MDESPVTPYNHLRGVIAELGFGGLAGCGVDLIYWISGETMRKLKSILSIMLLAVGFGTSAHAITFNFSATGPWDDPFFLISENPLGTITGTFEAVDTGDGLLQASEISSWSLIASGFTQALLNFSLSSAGGDILTTDNSGTTNEISPGFEVGLIDISDAGFNIFVQLDLQIPFGSFFGANISHAFDPSFGLYFTENLTINGQTFPAPIPLPASLPLLLGGFALIGIVSRRRRS